MGKHLGGGACRRAAAGAIAAGLGFCILGPRTAVAQPPVQEILDVNDTSRVVLVLRSGVFVPRAQSALFGFITDRLTMSRSDFITPASGIEVTVPVRRGISVLGVSLGGFSFLAGSDYARVMARSQFRERTDDDGNAIRQSTRLTMISGYLGASYALHQFDVRSRTVNWVVTTGAGPMHYRFRQWGDFVDETNGTIFSGQFRARGTSLMSFVASTGDVQLRDHTAAGVGMRYQWARGPSGDFKEVGPVDLRGLTVSLRLAVAIPQTRFWPAAFNGARAGAR